MKFHASKSGYPETGVPLYFVSLNFNHKTLLSSFKDLHVDWVLVLLVLHFSRFPFQENTARKDLKISRTIWTQVQIWEESLPVAGVEDSQPTGFYYNACFTFEHQKLTIYHGQTIHGCITHDILQTYGQSGNRTWSISHGVVCLIHSTKVLIANHINCI